MPHSQSRMMKSVVSFALCILNLSSAQLAGVVFPRRHREETIAAHKNNDGPPSQYKPNLRTGNKERVLVDMSMSVPAMSMSIPSGDDVETAFPTFAPAGTSYPTYSPTSV
jgi:hypothetical protein